MTSREKVVYLDQKVRDKIKEHNKKMAAEAKAKARAKADDHYEQHPEDADHDARRAVYMEKAFYLLSASTSEAVQSKTVISMALRLIEIDQLNGLLPKDPSTTRDVAVKDNWEVQADELSYCHNQYAKHIKPEKDSVISKLNQQAEGKAKDKEVVADSDEGDEEDEEDEKKVEEVDIQQAEGSEEDFLVSDESVLPPGNFLIYSEDEGDEKKVVFRVRTASQARGSTDVPATADDILITMKPSDRMSLFRKKLDELSLRL